MCLNNITLNNLYEIYSENSQNLTRLFLYLHNYSKCTINKTSFQLFSMFLSQIFKMYKIKMV